MPLLPTLHRPWPAFSLRYELLKPNHLPNADRGPICSKPIVNHRCRSKTILTVPGKTIPASRDRRQSKFLTGLCGCCLLLTCFSILNFSIGRAGFSFVVPPLAISLLFAAVVFSLRAATLGGTLVGAMICFDLVSWTRDYNKTLLHSALTPLLALFLLTWAATKTRRRQKERLGLAEPKHGRTAAQVCANLAVAALIITWLGATLLGKTLKLPFPFSYFASLAACLAALAEATADTLSSELGQVFGGDPWLGFRRVPPGTDGAISLAGTLIGVAGAAAITGIGWWAFLLTPRVAAAAFFASLIGFFADSLLGATVERAGWLGNDLVNFTSTLIAALAAAVGIGLLR